MAESCNIRNCLSSNDCAIRFALSSGVAHLQRMDLKYAINFLRTTRTAYETQQALAFAAGIDPGNLTRFMQNKQNISKGKLESLARELNSAVWEIFLLAELKEDGKERERIAAWLNMPAEQKDAVFRLTHQQNPEQPSPPTAAVPKKATRH